MSGLDKLLRSHVPPAVPTGLARRAVAEALKHGQAPVSPTPPRRDRRDGWKRPLWIGAASFGLAFTSAVAATVVSGGRIEIPVVRQMVASIPVLDQATRKNEPPRQIARAETPKRAPPAIMQTTKPEGPEPGQPGWRKAQIIEKLASARQRVEQRRAAGLPTPRADRIEAQAQRIVERRQASGMSTPSVEEVETGLALREIRQMRMLRSGRLNPATLTDRQLARIADRLRPEKRERFLALPPDMQRRLVVRTIERMRARGAVRKQAADPGIEGFSEVPR